MVCSGTLSSPRVADEIVELMLTPSLVCQFLTFSAFITLALLSSETSARRRDWLLNTCVTILYSALGLTRLPRWMVSDSSQGTWVSPTSTPW